MKQVTFITADFNTLDTTSEEFTQQYCNSHDCPMIRALRRITGNKSIKNCGEVYFTSKGTVYSPRSVFESVIRKIAERVKKNGKATFRLGVDISEIL
jgi:hypothetical protein